MWCDQNVETQALIFVPVDSPSFFFSPTFFFNCGKMRLPFSVNILYLLHLSFHDCKEVNNISRFREMRLTLNKWTGRLWSCSFIPVMYKWPEKWIYPLCIMCESMRATLLQSCPTLCDLMDCSPPGSSVHGILQARILEWVAISSSRGSSWSNLHLSRLLHWFSSV